MRPERLLIWLPLLGLAACSPSLVVHSATHHCWGIPWICQEWGDALHLATSRIFVLFPWLVVMSSGLRAGAVQLHRTRQAVRQFLRLPRVQLPGPLASLARDLNIQDRLDVVSCSSVDTFCYGFFRPRICVTTGLLALLSTAEIEAVLRHERHHLQRYDPLRSLLWTVMDGACWWMGNGSAQALLYRELVADRAVITAGRRVQLASALLKLLTHPQRGKLAAQDLAVSSLSVTDARIEQLFRPEQILPPTRPFYHWLVLPAMISLTMSLCVG